MFLMRGALTRGPLKVPVILVQALAPLTSKLTQTYPTAANKSIVYVTSVCEIRIHLDGAGFLNV